MYDFTANGIYSSAGQVIVTFVLAAEACGVTQLL